MTYCREVYSFYKLLTFCSIEEISFMISRFDASLFLKGWNWIFWLLFSGFVVGFFFFCPCYCEKPVHVLMKQQGRRRRTGDNFVAIRVGNSFQLPRKPLAGMPNAKCTQGFLYQIWRKVLRRAKWMWSCVKCWGCVKHRLKQIDKQ